MVSLLAAKPLVARLDLMRVLDRDRGTILASNCAVADSFLSRGLGLIPRAGLGADEGLLITRTGAITMFFMRFAIDAVFVDRERRVVRVARRLRPWLPMMGARGADAVLELPVGAIDRAGVQVGDELVYGAA